MINIKILLFILIVLGLSVAIYKSIKQFYIKKVSPDFTEPHFVVFPSIILLLWMLLTNKYTFIKLFIYPGLAKILFGILVLGLIGVLLFAGAVYYKIYGRDGNNEKMAGAQELKIIIKQTLILFAVAYVNLISTAPHARVNLLMVIILYYFGKKVYIRIIQAKDFADESGEQQDQTRLDNKILAFFFIGVFIGFFTNQQVMFYITNVYLLVLTIYYNKPLPIQEKFSVIKAPIGSEERDELFWEAFQAIEEESLDIQISGEFFFVEPDEDNTETVSFMDGEYTDLRFFDCFDCRYVWNDELDEEIMDHEEFSENMQNKLSEARHFDQYIETKTRAVHEYYFWGSMTNVPFYFSIRAFFEMSWDIILISFRISGVIYFSALWCLYDVYHTHQIAICWFEDYLIMKHVGFFSFCVYVTMGYIGCQDLKRPYSGLIFYDREETYLSYDYVHPYAIYGPAVDGSRNGQYGFFVVFGYLPSRSLILLPELITEYIRINELETRGGMGEVEVEQHDKEAENYVQALYPLRMLYHLLRNDSFDEKTLFRANLKKKILLRIEKRDRALYKPYFTKPTWGTHYRI